MFIFLVSFGGLALFLLFSIYIGFAEPSLKLSGTLASMTGMVSFLIVYSYIIGLFFFLLSLLKKYLIFIPSFILISPSIFFFFMATKPNIGWDDVFFILLFYFCGYVGILTLIVGVVYIISLRYVFEGGKKVAENGN